MDRLMILGAGGFGRELCGWLRSIQPAQSRWELAGFLDADPRALDDTGMDLPILGDPATFVPAAGDLLACGIGNPQLKRRLVTGLEQRGAAFLTVVHSSVIVGPACQLGRGCVLCPQVVVTTNVRLGDFVTLNVASTIGHDATVGSWSTINGHADVTGKCTLAQFVFLGSHAVVVPGKAVGQNSVVGAGSVVVRNVPPGCTVFGSPARTVSIDPSGIDSGAAPCAAADPRSA
jgi:sugar O-acyltransferase (sialic acid O-acetyltransferase NeuD family)